MGQLGKWTVWGRVTAAEDNSENIFDPAWGVSPTFNYRYCCGKQMSQPGLLEGVTSESDYSKFVRHCSIILCVHLSSPCHGFKNLTQFQHSSPSNRRGSRKLPNGFMHYSSWSLFRSLSLSLCRIRGVRRQGRKGQGEQTGERRGNQNAQTPHSAATSRKKKNTEAAASSDSSIRITSSLGLHCST